MLQPCVVVARCYRRIIPSIPSTTARSLSSSPSPNKDEYTHGHAPPVVQSHARRTAEEYAAHCVAKLRPGMMMLDVGCGPGSITKGFKKYVGDQGKIVGIDVEPLVVKDAAKLCGQDAEIEIGDVYKLRFKDNQFDVVHAHQVLQHLTKPVDALKEMKRVLKPGGILSLREVDYESWFFYPEDPRLMQWKAMYRGVAKRNNATPDAGRCLAHWLNAVDLPSTKAQFSGSTLLYTGERAKEWAKSWADRTTKTKLATQAMAMNLATRQELDEMGEAWLKWSAHPDALHFYVDVTAIVIK